MSPLPPDVDPQTVNVYAGRKPSPEQAEITAFFRALDTRQLELLDQAGKRVIEICSLLLGIFFGVVAFGDSFPPAYLASGDFVKQLTLLTLGLYMAALASAASAIRPRAYDRYPANITAAREELDKMVTYKTRGVQLAEGMLVAASLSLTVLIGLLILTA